MGSGMSDTDRDDIQGGHMFRTVLACVGLVQGLGFYVLAEAKWSDDALWLMAAATFSLLAPSTFQLAFRLGPLWKALAAALGFAALMSLLAFWMDWRIDWRGPDHFDDHRGVFFVTLPVVAYIAWAFLQTWTEQGGGRFPYASLFRFAWSNILIAAIAAAFLGVFWLVLVLWWSLFDLVGIRLFKDVFQHALFAWVFSGGVFGLGIAIARENGRLVPVLRRVVLMLFQVLAPVLAAASLMFLLVLPVTGLAPLWATKSATLVLVCLLFALSLFVNAVVQDGDRPLPFGRWMNWLMMATLLAMPVFAAIALYAVRLRIDQYGLTPERFIGQFVVVVAAVLALAYAAGVVWKRRGWPDVVTRVNPWIAALVVALALALLTPLADPYGWSAGSQLARLIDGKVDAGDFDYAYLKFQLGAPGRDALERLRAVKGHAAQSVIDARLAEVDKASSYWEGRSGPAGVRPSELPALRAGLSVRPEGAVLPDEVLEVVSTQRGWALNQCRPETEPCGVLVADVNKDGQDEYVLLSRGYTFTGQLVHRDGAEWRLREVNMLEGMTEEQRAAMWDAYLAGDIELVQPEYYDIRIGKNRLHY